jgi:hypothetical protein
MRVTAYPLRRQECQTSDVSTRGVWALRAAQIVVLLAAALAIIGTVLVTGPQDYPFWGLVAVLGIAVVLVCLIEWVLSRGQNGE